VAEIHPWIDGSNGKLQAHRKKAGEKGEVPTLMIKE
jgi:hypothetical protein